MPPRSSKCSHFPNFEPRKVLGLVTAHLMWPVFAYNACRFHEIFEGNGPCVALYSVGWASRHFHDLRSNSLTNFKIHATRTGHFFSLHVRNNYPAPAIHNRQTHYVDHVQIYYARVVEFASYMCKLVHSDPGLGKSISQSSARF